MDSSGFGLNEADLARATAHHYESSSDDLTYTFSAHPVIIEAIRWQLTNQFVLESTCRVVSENIVPALLDARLGGGVQGLNLFRRIYHPLNEMVPFLRRDAFENPRMHRAFLVAPDPLKLPYTSQNRIDFQAMRDAEYTEEDLRAWDFIIEQLGAQNEDPRQGRIRKYWKMVHFAERRRLESGINGNRILDLWAQCFENILARMRQHNIYTNPPEPDLNLREEFAPAPRIPSQDQPESGLTS